MGGLQIKPPWSVESSCYANRAAPYTDRALEGLGSEISEVGDPLLALPLVMENGTYSARVRQSSMCLKK